MGSDEIQKLEQKLRKLKLEKELKEIKKKEKKILKHKIKKEIIVKEKSASESIRDLLNKLPE